MTHTGTLLLGRLAEGELDAAGLLADWLEDHGDPRGARLRREWRRALAGSRLSWLRCWFCVDRRRWLKVTPAQRQRAVAMSLHHYAMRLLSVPPSATLPAPGSRVKAALWGCSR